MDIFEIFDYEEESIKEAKLKSREEFENSVEIYEKGNWSDALKDLSNASKVFLMTPPQNLSQPVSNHDQQSGCGCGLGWNHLSDKK